MTMKTRKRIKKPNFIISYCQCLAVVAAFLILCMCLSRIRLRVIVKGLKPLLLIIVLTGLLNMFYTPGRELVHFWIFTITWEGIRNAVFMISRIVMLIFGTFLLT